MGSVLVTGGCGFIGSSLSGSGWSESSNVVNLDKLTRGKPSFTEEIAANPHIPLCMVILLMNDA